MADFEAAKIVHENHLLLDQPFLRLPYELLRKNFRTAHWTVEKESTQVKSLLKDTATKSLNGRSSPEDVLKNLDAMLSRMRGLKRKLSSYADEETRLYKQVDARVAHLSELSVMQTVDDVKYQDWSRQRLDRLLVDYLLRHDYSDSAAAMTEKKGMHDLVDIETFTSMNKIRNCLEIGSLTEALAWCNENKKELRKMESNLEFMLRYQQYIELVRSQTIENLVEAINHAKKYLIPFKEAYPKEVHQAAGLLAFPPAQINRHRGHIVPYLQLYSGARWEDLADLFVKTHNNLLGIPSSPLLHIALSSGLSALKTPACHGTHSTAKGSSVCPICSTELNELAKAVPYAHHSKSHVEHDLLLLPNGRVYGKAKLEDYASKSGLPSEKVRDLVTGEEYDTGDLKKVYIT